MGYLRAYAQKLKSSLTFCRNEAPRQSLFGASLVDAQTKATTIMIQLASGILGAAAATLAFGTMHLEVSARGGPQQQVPAVEQSVAMPQIVRTGKGDRLTAPGIQGQNLTMSFRMPGASDSSVMMRIMLPAGGQNAVDPNANSNTTAPADRASTGKRMVACEPSVSVLTTVAKQLQPSRCVT